MTSTAGALNQPWSHGDRSPGADADVLGRTPLQLFWQRFREDRVALVALGFIVLEVLLAVCAPWVVALLGHPPNAQYPSALNPTYGTPTGPTSHFLFGVDTVGRDVFSRVLYGARVSLEIAIVATALVVAIGVVLGMVAGYFRGWADTLISRLIDVTLAFPILLLALGIASSCSLGMGCARGLIKPGLGTVTVAIVVVNWTYLGRIIRGQVLSLREKEFVEAARAGGAGAGTILFREILPNLVSPPDHATVGCRGGCAPGTFIEFTRGRGPQDDRRR